MRGLKTTTVECRFFYYSPHSFEPSRSGNSSQKSLFPSPRSNTDFTPDLLNYPIFRTNFRFPWRFENSGSHCNFGMIRVSLDVRTVNVFVFKVLWARFVHYFWAIRSPLFKSEGARTPMRRTAISIEHTDRQDVGEQKEKCGWQNTEDVRIEKCG